MSGDRVGVARVALAVYVDVLVGEERLPVRGLDSLVDRLLKAHEDAIVDKLLDERDKYLREGAPYWKSEGLDLAIKLIQPAEAK